MFLNELLQNRFSEAIKKTFPEIPLEPGAIDITPATSEKFGHYQCNTAMKLAGALKKKPREIAESIITALDKEGIADVHAAGPGFINIFFSPAFLSQKVDAILRDPRLGIPRVELGRRIIVEFSSPNVAKEMHVGHLRSTIIGDSIARLFEFLGADVLRLNHIGDWGTAFGMLIAYLKEKEPAVLSGEKRTDLPHLMHWYRLSKKLFDADEEFKKRARLEVVSLQGGEKESLKAWEIILEISRRAYQEIYDLLDIRIEERGESFYNPLLGIIIADLEEKGLITISDGAKCVFLEGFSIPLMVQKQDGGYNYDTTDMAAMFHRIIKEKADRIIILTDAGQSLHFALIRGAALKAGYLDPAKVRFDHVPFGLVLGPDGKKFKTREGETEKLIDLLYAAVEKAKEILAGREHDLSEEEKVRLAEILGVGAVKYADLSTNRVGDYQFSYDKMLRFEGNTAVFILYSYVRVNGIKRKIGVTDIDLVKNRAYISLKHPSEIALGVHLLQLGETLLAVREDLLPNHITDYLYILAQKFNAFFRDCRVEGTPEEDTRLLLCEAVSKTMELGLHLLGLRTAEKM